MVIFQNIKQSTIDLIKLTQFGNRIFYQLKHKVGKIRNPDNMFPELISIEVSSKCNMTCSYCPPHMKEYRDSTRKHTHMDLETFNKIIDEIDDYGPRQIALHKDGEPLLHPNIKSIFDRVKKNVSHIVYLTTNVQKLDQNFTNSLISNHIDVINFSIGAYSREFYNKAKGKGFNRVLNNIHNFLSSISRNEWKPKVLVQIIDLPEYPEMKKEIKEFKNYWKKFNVEISVWKKLSWGVFENGKFRYRYPCYSLWHSFNINSNGVVTACCMDWRQELEIGNIKNQSIKEIWEGGPLQNLRKLHIDGEEEKIDVCRICNYWKWQPMLMDYPVNN